MPTPLPADGVCALGTIPIVGPDGTISCWDPTEPGYPGPGTGQQKPEPNPRNPAGGGQPPAPPGSPVRHPTAPGQPVVSGPRQPGAPAAPYNPPGRIGLWPGPVFNPSPGSSSYASSSSSTSIGGNTLGEGPIFVNVNNATNIADNSAANALGGVADAVGSAISQSVEAASQAADSASNAVIGAITTQTGLISSSVGQVFGSLLNGITGIENGVSGSLGDIGTTIGNEIANSLNPSTTALEAIAVIISRQIGGLAGAVAQAVSVIIPQIVAAVSNPIGAVTGVLRDIEAAITGNVAALTQVGSDISGGFTGLDATLGRILTNYETYNSTFVASQTGYPDGGSLHHDLSQIVSEIAGITGRISGFNPKLADKLHTLCKGVDLDEALNKPVWDTSQPLWGVIPDWHKIFADILIWIFSVIPAVQKATQEVSQRMNQACPIDLIPPDALVDAVLRGYLPEADAIAEAGKGNLGESRFHLLKDLATHQMAPAQLLESFYRGIISSQDFGAALSAQGWTGAQQQLLQALGVSLLTVSESLELLRRGAIDATTLDTILKAHAYDDAQRKALSTLAFRPQNISEAVSGEASNRAFQGLGAAIGPDVYIAPEFVQTAGSAEGLDPDATTARWLSHWNTGSLGNWISLYFRSQITYPQLEAAAAREFVPASVLPALIDSQRPLVQFRTISTALRVGIIKEADARLLLAQHGYTPNNIDVLIAYAQRPGPAKAAKNAQALHSVSLGIAKEEYIDGSITGDQYLAILTQHGYTVDGANTELQVVNAHQALLRRKEEAQLVIDEFGAGLIDEKAALAQLAVLGLTVDELARAAHKIRAFRAKTAKHPTESELNHFLNLSIITPDEYVAELTAQGYSNKWAKDFLAWRQHPTPTASSGPQPPSPSPVGP